MDLLCNQCQLVIQIPDERVSLLTSFRVTCPHCKWKTVVPSASGKEEVEMLDTPLTADLPPKAPNSEVEMYEGFLCKTLDTLHPGDRTCLMCFDQDKDHAFLKSLLAGMGYLVDFSPSPEHALQRLRFNQYHIIVLDDSFGGRMPNPVASYLAKLNMNTRRDIFVILLGEQFKTADQWQAFVESVDLVCHPISLRQLPVIMKSALSEHERFYKVFNDCLITAGKKFELSILTLANHAANETP